MEIWVWYTFWSIITMVILSLLDYNVVKSFFKSSEAPTIVWGVAMVWVFIYTMLFHWIDTSNYMYLLGSYILGLFSLWGSYFYFKSLFHGTSPWTLASIMKLQIVFAFIVWVFIFREQLNSLQLLGHAIIFGWAMYLAIKDFKVSKQMESYIFPLLAMALWTISVIGMDYLYGQYDFWTLFWIHSLWMFSWAMVLLFYTNGGKEFQIDFKKRAKKYILIWILTESFAIAMETCDALAYKTWPLSKVTFLRETYPVLLILIALFLRPYFPKYIPEEWWDSKFEKIIVVSIMLVWVYLTIR